MYEQLGQGLIANSSDSQPSLGKSVLDMTPQEARTFFLKRESYCRLDLPTYFDFSNILDAVNEQLLDKSLFSKANKLQISGNTGHTIYSNKNGRYAWRPFQLIHPALYVDLTHKITDPLNWETILLRFEQFRADPRIRCLSVPHESLTENTDEDSQILGWWQGVEQASIKLALEFNYVFHADISNCYGSIYTHSIAWALHDKETAKKERCNQSLVGNVIDLLTRHMNDGQTNGIPQGSVLFDFVAEMILGFVDARLSAHLTKKDIKDIVDFQILRYRDDYRIFTNSPRIGEEILKTLTEELMDLGLKLNTDKTSGPESILSSVIKKDKFAWMRSKQIDSHLQKHLLLIHQHAAEFPNAGSTVKALREFSVRLSYADSNIDITPMISIAVDIALQSPRCFPICTTIISQLLAIFSSNDEKLDTLNRIRTKFAQLPNHGYLEIWQQRMSYPIERKIEYTEKLCRLINGEPTELWESDWITSPSLKETLKSMGIVNHTVLDTVPEIVQVAEVSSLSTYD